MPTPKTQNSKPETRNPKPELRPFDPARYLKSDEEIAIFLEECLAEGDPALTAHALGVVARARGMSALARETGLSREGLYKALGEGGNPEFATVLKVVHALGLRLRVTPATPRASG